MAGIPYKFYGDSIKYRLVNFLIYNNNSSYEVKVYTKP